MFAHKVKKKTASLCDRETILGPNIFSKITHNEILQYNIGTVRYLKHFVPTTKIIIPTLYETENNLRHIS